MAENGIPKISSMSLEEPEECDTQGLKAALEKSIEGLQLIDVDRKTQEIGLCSDGAPVNFALYKLLKNDIGGHYLHNMVPRTFG